MSTFHLNSAGFILDLKMKEHPPSPSETIPDYHSSYTTDGIEEISSSPFHKPSPYHSTRELLPMPHHTTTVTAPPKSKFGDPTPIALGGFLLANTPATIIGRRGRRERERECGWSWIQNDTFSATIFFTLGGYFGASGATLVPFHNAIAGYGSSGVGADLEGLDAYHDSYAVFLVFMGVLMVIFMVGSLRVDVVHVAIFAAFAVCFPCLAAAYFVGGNGRAGAGYMWRVVGAWMSLIGSVLTWYLFLGSFLGSVDFPLTLPVGDLSGWIKGKSEKRRIERHTTRVSIGGRV